MNCVNLESAAGLTLYPSLDNGAMVGCGPSVPPIVHGGENFGYQLVGGRTSGEWDLVEVLRVLVA